MDKKYNFCIINKNNITLYNTSYVNVALPDEALVDVKCELDEKNNLIIYGTPIVFEYAMDKININELEHSPCKKYIKHYEPNKFYKFFGAKPYDYVQYWWGYIGKDVKYIFNNFKIKILE